MPSKITIRKDGLRQMSYYVTLSNGVRKRQYVYGHSAQEVRKKYDEAVNEAYMGHPTARSKMTLEQYLNEWLPKARKIRESTRANYAGEIRKHIIPKIGKKRLSNLTTAIMQELMDNLNREGVSSRTLHILKNILSKALREAEKQNLVRPNIMKYVELESYKPKERKIWSEDDAKKFSEAIKKSKYYFIFLVCITYGLRRGEAIAIKWKDIDNGIIRIRRQYTLVDGTPTLCDLKTAHSVRDLPILPHIQEVLLQLSTPNTTEYIISDNGKPINPYSLNHEFKKIKRTNNLPNVPLHSLRHFAATSLKNAGVTVKEAQEILGHSTPVTTMQYYQHSSIEDKRTALAKYAEKMNF